MSNQSSNQTTNQANAQFSTGPRTPEGKAISSQNARKHGLSAKSLSIQPADQEDFNDLLAQYQREINPQGPIQQTLFEELVAAAWNLRRVRTLQSELEMLDYRYERLDRYHVRFERTFHRTLKELRTLQTEAALHHMLPRETRHKTPILASPLIIAKRSQERQKEFALNPRQPQSPPIPDAVSDRLTA